MSTTSAQRMRDLRDRRRAAGLVKVEVWVLPEQTYQIRALAEKLNSEVDP
jgi:hypothetical protein